MQVCLGFIYLPSQLYIISHIYKPRNNLTSTNYICQIKSINDNTDDYWPSFTLGEAKLKEAK